MEFIGSLSLAKDVYELVEMFLDDVLERIDKGYVDMANLHFRSANQALKATEQNSSKRLGFNDDGYTIRSMKEQLVRIRECSIKMERDEKNNEKDVVERHRVRFNFVNSNFEKGLQTNCIVCSFRRNMASFNFSATLITETSDLPRVQGSILPIPPNIAKEIPTRPDRTRRVNVLIEKLPVYQAKIAGDGHGGYFVPVNKQRREWLEEQHGCKAKLKVVLTPDTSTYGLPVPPAFQVLLDEDALVRSFFDALSAGVQRRILFSLGSSKRESTQLHRAVATAEYLVEVRGKVSLKELAGRWRLPKSELNH